MSNMRFYATKNLRWYYALSIHTSSANRLRWYYALSIHTSWDNRQCVNAGLNGVHGLPGNKGQKGDLSKQEGRRGYHSR